MRAVRWKVRKHAGNPKLEIERKDDFQKLVNSLDPGIYWIAIGKYEKGFSDPQRGYLWGCLYAAIAIETGEDDLDWIHKNLLVKYATETMNPGQKIPHVVTTSDMTTVEGTRYMEWVRAWAARNLNLKLPLPNEDMR